MVRKVGMMLAILFGIACLPAATQADPIIVQFKDGQFGTTFGYGHGGEFDVYDATGKIRLYTTFCLERNEYIAFSSPHNAFVNTAAINGGVGGAVGGKDELDGRTARLYELFRNGSINIDSTNKGNAFQAVVWLLENEITQAQYDALATGTADQKAVKAQADIYFDKVKGWTGGIGNVRVLNVFTPGGIARQDQLTLISISIPEVSTLLLLGLSFAGSIPGLRRLRRKA